MGFISMDFIVTEQLLTRYPASVTYWGNIENIVGQYITYLLISRMVVPQEKIFLNILIKFNVPRGEFSGLVRRWLPDH